MLLLRILALTTVLFSGLAKADLIYDFNIDANAGIDAFSFSFTVPTFVADGESPAFMPFNVTNGTDVWTMTNDLAGVTNGVPLGCFMFDNGGTSSLQAPCGAGVYAPPDGAFYVSLAVPLPTETGVYTLSGSGLFDLPGAGTVITSPAGTLEIAATPEPRTSGLLISIAVAALGWKLRKQLGAVSQFRPRCVGRASS